MAKMGISEKKEKTIIGIFDLENMAVEIEGATISLSESLAGYDGMNIKIVAGNKKEKLEITEADQSEDENN